MGRGTAPSAFNPRAGGGEGDVPVCLTTSFADRQGEARGPSPSEGMNFRLDVYGPVERNEVVGAGLLAAGLGHVHHKVLDGFRRGRGCR